MVDIGSAGTILKILSGVQAGIEVALLDGTYILGSGDDDDIQLFDVSLLPGHARIVVGEGKVRLAGAAGALRSRNGLVLDAGGELQEVEPLDILSAGTARFALGPRTGNWTSIGQLGDGETGAAADASPARTWPEMRWLRSLAAAGVVLLLAGGVWSSHMFQGSAHQIVPAPLENELVRIREALSRVDPDSRLQVRQDVDGMIYVTGFVSSLAERRAVLAAVNETGVPARTRVFVLDVMRSEIAALLEAERAPFQFALANDGQLTVEGVMLDDARAARIVDMLRERVAGVSSVVSNVRTGTAILAEVTALAERSQIAGYVLLRLDRDLIEASGVLPSDKIDAWVGFLQAYSSQFASLIPLRSFVYLEGSDSSGTAIPTTALFLGPGSGRKGDVGLDIDRLKRGTYQLSDIFAERRPDGPAAKETVANEPRSRLDLESLLSSPRDAGSLPARVVYPATNDTGKNGAPSSSIVPAVPSGPSPPDATIPQEKQLLDILLGNESPAQPATTPKSGGADTIGGNPQSISLETATIERVEKGAGASSNKPTDPGNSRPAMADGIGLRGPGPADIQVGNAATAPSGGDAQPEDRLTSLARRLVNAWLDGSLAGTEEGAALTNGLQKLQDRHIGGNRSADDLPVRYAPMLASRDIDAPEEACWQDSQLTRRNVAAAMFWLDLLSVSSEIELAHLDAKLQIPILTAALNPERTRICAEAATDTVRSVYLHEIGKNPDFIRHIVRGMSEFPIDIVGASIGRGAYVQTRGGSRLQEGSAPDESSRLIVIGELGLAIQREKVYLTRLFDSSLNWIVR